MVERYFSVFAKSAMRSSVKIVGKNVIELLLQFSERSADPLIRGGLRLQQKKLQRAALCPPDLALRISAASGCFLLQQLSAPSPTFL